MPEDAALLLPIPQAHSTPQLQRQGGRDAAERQPREREETQREQRGLSARSVNASPPAALALGAYQRSCAPATVGTHRGAEQPAPAAVSAQSDRETESSQLSQAREHIARLQRDLTERDRALQRLSEAHDAGVRRQIAMQQQLNGTLPRGTDDRETESDDMQWQAL